MKPVLLFIYSHENEELWRDGLWAALQTLKHDYKVVKWNIHTLQDTSKYIGKHFDFVLGWGAFGSDVDHIMEGIRGVKKGLCIGGNAYPAPRVCDYDVLFYETEWIHTNYLQNTTCDNMIHAFGVNADIYCPQNFNNAIFDWLTVGSFSLWKRHELFVQKPGTKMAIGQIQKNNLAESMGIISDLLAHGVVVSDMLPPEKLAQIYQAANQVYIPADLNGGGERAILEARSCGVSVEVAPDNPKLQELLKSPIWDQEYYAEQLKSGILLCI